MNFFVPVAPACHAQLPSTAQLQNCAGEYTDLTDPDTPFDVYVNGGKLTIESERLVPTVLNPQSVTEFKPEGSKNTITFKLDDQGRATELIDSSMQEAVFKRTGEPVRHVFHAYVASDVMIPMRDGVKLHAIVLKPSDISTPLPIHHGSHSLWR